MTEVTQILSRIEQGDPSASEQLLPLIYEELRKLAAQRLAQEKPGQTLQATALVHDAYIRLVDVGQVQSWNSRGHFFAAAAEAMRRILVERARRQHRLKHGGEFRRVQLPNAEIAQPDADEVTLAVDECLDALAVHNSQAAEIVRLRYFGGLTLQEASAALEISPRTADRLWSYAKAWLHRELQT
jgi:RNA polymerase sigma factor (TIGR02999 family)